MRCKMYIAALVMLLVGVAFGGPPETPGTPVPPSTEPPDVPTREKRSSEPSSPEDYKDKKFIEIRIDADGIRAVDLDGNEIVYRSGPARADEEARKIYEKAKESERSGSGRVEFGSINIAEDEEIDGDVMAIKGDISIEGVVNGNVFATGSVTLGSKAVVTGDIVARRLVKDPSAELQGRFKEFYIGESLPPFPIPGESETGLPGLLAWLLVVVYTVGLSMLVVVIFRRPVKRVKHHIEKGFGKSLLVGFLMVLAMPPVFVLLLITIIGIPVAVLVYPFVIIGAVILGFIGGAYYAGDRLARLYPALRFGSIYLTVAVGIVAVTGFWLLSGLMKLLGFHALTGICFAFGLLAVAAATMSGIGGVLFSRFGVRPKDIESPVTPETPDTSVNITISN